MAEQADLGQNINLSHKSVSAGENLHFPVSLDVSENLCNLPCLMSLNSNICGVRIFIEKVPNLNANLN